MTAIRYRDPSLGFRRQQTGAVARLHWHLLFSEGCKGSQGITTMVERALIGRRDDGSARYCTYQYALRKRSSLPLIKKASAGSILCQQSRKNFLPI